MTQKMKNSSNIKEHLYQKCVDFIENRLQTVQYHIKEIQETLMSETKSSAGDKHETGRAMLQLEREKAGHQLSEIEKLKEHLLKMDINKSSETVAVGSVVYTSSANYFIATSAGEIEYSDERFYAISPSTPIAQLMLGKEKDDTITFRDQQFIIEKVL